MCLQFTYPEELRPQPVVLIPRVAVLAAHVHTQRIGARAMAHMCFRQGEALVLLHLQVQSGDESWRGVFSPQGGQAPQHHLPPEGCQLLLQTGLGVVPTVGPYVSVQV